MGKIINYKVFLVLFLIFIVSVKEFPQEAEGDRTNRKSQFQLKKLDTNLFDDLELFLYLNRNSNTGSSYYIHNKKTLPLSINTIVNSDLLTCNSKSETADGINVEFNSYLKFRSGLRLKTDLGITGIYLIKSKKLAAFILFVAHLIKYR